MGMNYFAVTIFLHLLQNLISLGDHLHLVSILSLLQVLHNGVLVIGISLRFIRALRGRKGIGAQSFPKVAITVGVFLASISDPVF